MANLRTIVLGMGLASANSLGSASAADVYPTGGGYKDYGYATVWEGPYFGIHGGGAWGSVDVKDHDINYNTFSNGGSGAFGGGTIGWNWQFGQIVYSAELDLGVMDISHTSTDPLDPTVKAHIDSGVYGDIAGRVGYAFDRTLVYAKGGFGFFNGPGTVKSSSIPDETYKTQSFYGWTAGAGLEYKITPNWSIKAEYLHFDVGDDTEHYINGGNPGGARWNTAVSIDTLKAGVNYEILDIREPLK
jgi:outer membrane immunogenic protein